MTILLKLKHWQLFMLTFGVMFVFQIFMMTSMMSGKPSSWIFMLMPVIMVFYMILFFGWFYTVGTNLHKKLPASAPMNLKRFKIFLSIPVIYISIICIGMFGIFSSLSVFNGRPNPAIFALIVPIHLFSMFCIFYCLYFNAKALKSVEMQAPATFSDYAGEFFLIWFFPIGVWFIQPRINKMFDPENDQINNEILDNTIHRTR